MTAKGLGRMHPVTAEIWRYVRDCGATGAWSQDIYLRFTEQGQRAVTRVRINTLVLQDFIKGQGDKRNRLYHVTEKVPVGQSLQLHAAEEARQRKAKPTTRAGREELADDDTEALFAPRQPVNGVPPGVPNSVFAIGAQFAGLPPPRFDLDPAVGTLVALATADYQVGQVMLPPGFGPKLPAAPAPAPVPREPLAPARNGVPVLPAALLTPPAPPAPPAPAKPAPMFALYSNGSLVIRNVGNKPEPFELPPDATRALFRWLDRLGGTDLTSLCSSQGAAS